MYSPIEHTHPTAINLVMSAVMRIEKDIYPAMHIKDRITRLLPEPVAKMYNIPAKPAKEWVEQVIRNNMELFNLEGGWSDCWSNNQMDIRLFDPDEDGKNAQVVVVPWDSVNGQHDHDNEWVLFDVNVNSFGISNDDRQKFNAFIQKWVEEYRNGKHEDSFWGQVSDFDLNFEVEDGILYVTAYLIKEGTTITSEWERIATVSI